MVGEQLGRRKSIAIGCVIMIVGAVLQATSYSRAQIIVARIVSGFGMGAINVSRESVVGGTCDTDIYSRPFLYIKPSSLLRRLVECVSILSRKIQTMFD